MTSEVESTPMSEPAPKSWIPRRLLPFLSPAFLKFCSVGASGVIVNLGFLFVFADLFGLHPNFASAVAIELSIVSNFLLNELWTFRDRRAGATVGLAARAARFHLVALVGAVVQWLAFVYGNVAILGLGAGAAGLAEYTGSAAGFVADWVFHPILSPPDVGGYKYLSQLAGIALATFWNFLANFHWTWRQRTPEGP